MKTQFLILQLFSFLFTVNLYSQNSKMLTPVEMKQDIDSLTQYLEETHIDPFYRYSRDKFVKDIKSVKKKLTTNLNLVDFYIRIEPLLAKLEDGHTDLRLPIDEYRETNPYQLPYNFSLKSKRPYIICENVYEGFTSEIPENAEILSINGIPSKKIVKDIINLNTGETLDFRAEYGAYNFNFYLENLYKTNGNYRIEYRSNHQTQSVTIKGLKINNITEIQRRYRQTQPIQDNENENNYALQIFDNLAVIDFKSFDWNGFQKFTDSAFTQIKNKGIQNLVINLMDNGGGDSDVGDEFFQYLLNKPYKQYDKVIEKNSPLLKKRLKEHLKNREEKPADLTILNAKNGSIDTVYYDQIPLKENSLRFTGNIYLLINTRTFSSAADFAQCFKYYKRGVIIGQESGGLIKSFGDIVSARLTNSNLELTVSSKLYYDIGAKDNDWIGVVPDIKADRKETALQIINDLIKKVPVK